jgi:hypothetical protein
MQGRRRPTAGALAVVAAAVALAAAATAPGDARMEVENPTGSGKFEPASAAIVRTLQPRLRVTFPAGKPAAFRVLLAGAAPGTPPRDVTPLFQALAGEGTATVPLDVAAGPNTLILLTGTEPALAGLRFETGERGVRPPAPDGGAPLPDGGTPAPDGGTAAGSLGSLVLPAGVTAQTATLIALSGKEISVAPREVLPLVHDPGAGTLVEQATVIIQFAPRTPLAEISKLLRSQHLEPAGMNLVTSTVRARITDGRAPSAVARALKKLPRVKVAVPNPAAQPQQVLGERLPDRLRTTYLEHAGNGCVPGAQLLHGCFDSDGPDPTNELRISRQHWLMGTFAGHRLVDAIVGPNPAVRPAFAMVDTGLGNGTNTSDLPIDPTGLYGFSFAPFAWTAAGVQSNVLGPIGIAQVQDTAAHGHGSQVVAAAAGRGTLSLGAGKDLRVRPIRASSPAGLGSWQDNADGVQGACLDPAVSVVIMEVGNAVWAYHATGTPPNLAADLAAQAADAPGIQAILQPVFALCRRPFLDVGLDGVAGTVDPGEGDGAYQLGEPFSDTDGDGRFDPDRDGKILALPLGNDGMNLGAVQMPSSFVPTGIRAPNALFAIGVAAAETNNWVDHLREPERLADYSNFGPHVSVTALADQTIFPDPSGTLSQFGGTSAATPVAAGVLGEMIFLDRNQRAHPPLGPLQHIELIEATAEEYGSTQVAPSVPKANDAPGHPGEAPDAVFGYGRVSAWKALLSVANGGLARESHRVDARGRPIQFPSVPTLRDADTHWYGFKLYTPVLGATVWLDGTQLQDRGAAAPGNGNVVAYAGVRDDRIVLLGIDANDDGVLDEDPMRGIVPIGNEGGGGRYVATFSVERADLLGGGGRPRTLALRKPGQTAADAPFFTLALDLTAMREGHVPGVVFDDFVFEVTSPDFGDAPDQGGQTMVRGTAAYPTSLLSLGARHLDSSLEWLGQPDRPVQEAVSPEHDATSSPSRRVVDPDGIENVRAGGQGETPRSDLDRFDDGVLFFPLTYVPGQTGKVQLTVCVQARWAGRYTGHPTDVLYVNGWIDWNGVDGWQEAGGEHVLDGVVIDPSEADWFPRGAANMRFVSDSPSRRCGTVEVTFPVPASIAKGPLWARFRLDYGENLGRVPPGAGRIPSDPSLSLTRGAARYGEVEDSLIGSDFSDAPDPNPAAAAHHLDFNREWLGKPRKGGIPSATRETSACDTTAAEEDGVPNLGADCKGSDADQSDDAVVPPDATPGGEVSIELDVSARVDAFGFTNRGPAGESSAGVKTLAPDCTLKPIAAAVGETPSFHRDRGRYAAWDPRRRLYLHAWADWNGDGAFDAAEEVITGPLDPEAWGGDGRYTPGESFTDADGNGVWTEGEAFTDAAGAVTRHFSCTVEVPKSVVMGKKYFWRFRLDYGEDAVLHDEVPHHSGEDGRALASSSGGALFGEVEDYPQCAAELDEMQDTTAELTVEGPFGAQRLHLAGPTTIVADICHVGDADGDGLESVKTEVVAMDLHGFSLVGPVSVKVRDPGKHPNQRSIGEIEEQANNTKGVLDIPPFASTGKAESYFDVWFETQVAGRTLHSHEPKRMKATISYKPPRDTYRSPDVMELFDEEERAGGVRVGGASHTTGEDARVCDRRPKGALQLQPEVGLAGTGLPFVLGASVAYTLTPDERGSLVVPFSLQLGGGGLGLMLPVGFQYELSTPWDGLRVVPRLSAGYALELFGGEPFHNGLLLPEVGVKYTFCGGLSVGAIPLSFPIFVNPYGLSPTWRILVSGGTSF